MVTEQAPYLPCHMETIKRKEGSVLKVISASRNPSSSIPVYHEFMDGRIIFKVINEKGLKRLLKMADLRDE
ncbi:hypothetical protein Q4O60_01920 [Aeribacillus pallidus]|nr:hypothetical protein [Aeribacillus pallidus]